MEKSNNGKILPFATGIAPSKTPEEPKFVDADTDSTGLAVLARIADSLEEQKEQLRRLADHFDPQPSDVVDSVYVAQKLACTTSWIGQMARRREIPDDCIVTGTGNGKPWKFHRIAIEGWIKQR